MARILGVVIYVWEELLKEGWHASDATSDTIVKLRHEYNIKSGNNIEHLSTTCVDANRLQKKE